MLAEDIYKLEETLQQMASDCPSGGNPFKFDEYCLANEAKEIVEKRNYPEFTKLMKKPLFGFLENELVK